MRLEGLRRPVYSGSTLSGTSKESRSPVPAPEADRLVAPHPHTMTTEGVSGAAQRLTKARIPATRRPVELWHLPSLTVPDLANVHVTAISVVRCSVVM